MTDNRSRSAPFFPAAPARRLVARVVADCDGNLTAASLALQVDRGTLHRLLNRDRLRSDAADRIAVTLGRHPSELWPDWFADEPVSR
jgi:lambda repressor-like predicted transcriptional regulator